MNFLKRSLKYIMAKKVKTILFAIIFLFLGNLVIIGFGVSQASDNAKVLARKKMNPVVSYEYDYSSMVFEDDYNYVDLKLLDEMAKDKRVKAVSSIITSEAQASDFDPVKPKRNDDIFDDYEDEELEDKGITIKGTRYNNMIEFANGTYEIVEGKQFTDADFKAGSKVVMIEEELAENNNLHVGDLIDINILDSYMAEELEFDPDETTITVKIVAIYKSNVEDDNSYYTAGYKANLIIFPIPAFIDEVMSVLQKEYDYYYKLYGDELDNIEVKEEILYSSASFLLDDPKDLDSFVSDYKAKVGKGFKLNTNDEAFKKYSKPLDTISMFSNIIVWALLINAIIIITLVTALTLKSREYEIGVLVSLGVQKWKVIMQLFLEILIIAMVSFTLASVTGSLVSKKVGEKVLDVQSSFSGDDEEDVPYLSSYYYGDGEYFSEINKDTILAEYKVTVDAKLIIKIFIVGILVVFVSILVPALMILRYNPKQILMTTN